MIMLNLDFFGISVFWWALLWICIGGSILAAAHVHRHIFIDTDAYVERWKPLPAILLILPLVAVAALRLESLGDTAAVIAEYNRLPLAVSEWGSCFAATSKDWLFSLFALAVRLFAKEQTFVYLGSLALIQLVCIALVCARYSSHFWFSIYLFFTSAGYISWVCGDVRQFTAACVVFACAGLIQGKGKIRFIPLVLLVLFAATIHVSALIMLPMIFIMQGKFGNIFSLLGLAAETAFLWFLNSKTDILGFVFSELPTADTTTEGLVFGAVNMDLIRFGMYVLPILLILVCFRQVSIINERDINGWIYAGILAAVLFGMGYFLSSDALMRLAMYPGMFSLLLLLPWEIEEGFTIESKKPLESICFVLFAFLFFCQVYFALGIPFMK